MDGSSRGAETSTWVWVVTAFVGASGDGSHLFTDLFFFLLQTLKIKNFKKEFKEKKKKKKKDFCRKETYFQNADPLLQSSGMEQCCFPLRPSPWTRRRSPSSRRRAVVTVLHTRTRAQENQGSRGTAPHHFMCFVTQLLALKMLLKKIIIQNKGKKNKKKEGKKKPQRRKIPNL